MNQQADDLRDFCAALHADNNRLREAVQGLLDALPSATAHPAIVAAKAALAGHPEPTSHACELPDGLIPASPDLEYLRSVTGNSNLPAYMRGQIMSAVRRLAQPQPSGDAGELPDAVRVPLDSLHADAGYLIGRVMDESLTRDEAVAVIRSCLDEARAKLAAQPSVQYKRADIDGELT